jgi:hypothetical protein
VQKEWLKRSLVVRFGGAEMADKIKLSLLRKWRTQAMEEAELNLKVADRMSEDERHAYRCGFVRGWNECKGTLSLQKIIKIIID